MNKTNVIKYLVYTLIGLSVIGLGYQLFNKPGQIIQSIFLFAVLAGIFFVIYNLMLNKKDSNYSSYKKAAKQASKKYGNPNSRSKVSVSKNTLAKSKKVKSQPVPLKKKRRTSDHLTVIEGNKGKKKDRRSM